jgi:hypothetical protein
MSTRSSLALLVLGALGAVLTLLNLEQPFVRNELIYARAAEHVIANDYDPRPVVADSALSHDKPVGFAWLGAPLVAWFGTHAGLRVLSFPGTLFFLWAALRFLRAFAPFGQSDRERAAALVLVGLNPIVAYQFWSAHPDSLFAGLVLVAWTLVVRMVEEPERAPLGRAALLGLVCAGGLVVKNYALILLGSVPLYVLFHLRVLLARPRRPWKMLGGVAVAMLVAAAFAFLGWKGGNPLVRLAGEGGGVGQYNRGALAISAGGTLLQVAVFAILNLHVALLFVPRARRVNRRVVAGILSFALLYVVGLMDFPTTYYNMRYFLPLLPFLALLAVEGWKRAEPATRRWTAGAYALVALALIVSFGVGAVYRLVGPTIPPLVFEPGYGKQGLLDNLRMSAHLSRADELARVNAEVDPDGVLYMVNCNYYGDAMHGVYEGAGLIRGDIQTRYVGADAMQPDEERFYAWVFYGDGAFLSDLGEVVELGPKLYKVTRKA